MGIFNKIKIKGLVALNNCTGKCADSAEKVVTKTVSNGFTTLYVIYYRYYDVYKVYREIYKDSETKDCKIVYSTTEEYLNLDELEDNYKKYNLELNLMSCLSVSYVYATNSGVFCEGVDLRTELDQLTDNIFYTLLSNRVLDKVNLVTKSLNYSLYNEDIILCDKKNKYKWSPSVIEDSLNNGRMSVLLSPVKGCIQIEDVTERVMTNPRELYIDVINLSKLKNVYVSHCGNFGIQLDFK